MFTYKPRLIGESGFSLMVAYQLNNVFRIQIRSFTYKPRGFLPGIYGKLRVPTLYVPARCSNFMQLSQITNNACEARICRHDDVTRNAQGWKLAKSENQAEILHFFPAL